MISPKSCPSSPVPDTEIGSRARAMEANVDTEGARLGPVEMANVPTTT